MVDNPRRSLVDKLGIKPTGGAYTLHAPHGYAGELPFVLEVNNIDEIPETYEWLQAFYVNKNDLEREIATIKDRLAHDGQLWISWPKKSSGVNSDLNENIIREIGLNAGIVDVKVAAIDETWSGLKFVYRLKDRQ